MIQLHDTDIAGLLVYQQTGDSLLMKYMVNA